MSELRVGEIVRFKFPRGHGDHWMNGRIVGVEGRYALVQPTGHKHPEKMRWNRLKFCKAKNSI